MTKEQMMIEANFNLFVGYLKLDEQKTNYQKNFKRSRVLG